MNKYSEQKLMPQVVDLYKIKRHHERSGHVRIIEPRNWRKLSLRKNRTHTVERNASGSIWRSVVITTIPMFFSTVLFSIVLESYKSDSAARKDMLFDLYRPMRETQAECLKTHNNLFLQYGKLAGHFQLAFDEIKHLASTDGTATTGGYQAFLEGMFSSLNKAGKDAATLEENLSICQTRLSQKYEELALATGTYSKFAEFSKARDEEVNMLMKKRASFSGKAFEQYDAKDLIKSIRDIAQLSTDNPDSKNAVINKIGGMSNATVNYYIKRSENEQEIFKADIRLAENLQGIFSGEIDNRFKRGFISRHFF